MPKGYEKMRDKFKREGMGDKAAKGKAARIWNSKHPNDPVTRKKEKKHFKGASMHEMITMQEACSVMEKKKG